MGKAESRSYSFRFRKEVGCMLGDIAGEWGCGQTAAMERMIAETHAMQRGGKSFEEKAKREVNHAPVITHPNVAVSTGPRAMDGYCVHCERGFELMGGGPPTSICRGCVVRGHKAGQVCMKCAEDEHYAKKAAKSTSSEPEGIDFAVDWGA